jgi:ribosome-binding protein aMBF1 (putative translation factor)
MGGDVLHTRDKPATASTDDAAPGPALPASTPGTAGGEAGVTPARAADNESEKSFTHGRRLRRARMARQWSQLQLAHRMREVGADHRGTAALHSLLIMISKWENDRKHPNQYSLHLIAAALEIDVESLGLPVDQDFVF